MHNLVSRLRATVIRRFPAVATVTWPVAWRWIESLLSLAAMALLQIGGFIILARSLGVEAYGVIVAIAATVGIAVEFVGLGCGEILIRAVARDSSSYPGYFGQALILVAITLPVVVALAIIGENILFSLPAPLTVVALLTVSDLVTARASVLAEHVAIAHRAIRVANAYRFLAAAAKGLAIVIACLLFNVRTLDDWWPWQVAQAAICMLLYGYHLIWRFGKPRFALEMQSARRGLSFALNQVLRATQFNIDRMIIGTFGSTAVLGIYGAATRLVQVAMLPIQALLRMTYPVYFARGRHGMPATWAFACQLLPLVLVLSFGITCALLLAAEFIIPLLGTGFTGAESIVRWLSPLPIAAGMQYIFADALTGADRQGVRTSILAAGLVVNAGFMALGASWFGIAGIVAAALISNVLLMVVLIGTTRWLATEAKS